MEEFISIELPCSSITKMLAYCYQRLREDNLSSDDRTKLENLVKQLYKEKGLLYRANNEITRQIIEKVEKVYRPFLRSYYTNDGTNTQHLSETQELYPCAV
jgi:acyl-[acyl carrier protein]--UDP-N-acetylglucosamine O-acyltransferase